MTKRTLSRAALAALLLNAIGPVARAADVGWDAGGGADNTWGNANNWTSNAVPGFLDNIILTAASAAGPQTIDLNGTRSITRIEANGVAGTYTFANSGAGGALGFFAAPNVSIILNQTPGSTLIFDSDLALNAAGELFFNTDQDGGRIIVNGDVTTAAASGITTLNLTTRNLALSDVVQVHGVISDGPTARMALTAGHLPDAANHRGHVRVSGLNTFTGPTTVNGATLLFNSIADYGPGAAPSALGAPTALADAVISLGATVAAPHNVAGMLRYVGTAPGGHASNRPFQFTGFSPGGTIESSGVGPLLLSGGLTSTSSSSVNRTLTLGGSNGGENVFSGVIADVPGAAVQHLTKAAAGKWVITAANTYDGSTTVSGGELVLQGASSRIGPVTAGALNVSASGTFTLDGGITRFNDFNNAGTFNFKSGEMELISGNTTTGGGSFAIGTNGVGRVTLNGGSNNFGDVALHGSDDFLVLNAGGTFAFTSIDNSVGGHFSAVNVNVQLNGGLLTTTHGEIRSRIQGSGGLRKSGNDGTTLDITTTAGNTYTGETLIASGTLRLVSSVVVNHLPDNGMVQIGPTAVLDLTQKEGGEMVGQLAGAGTIRTAPLRGITVNNAPANSFAGTITGGGSFTKQGNGDFTLEGASDYTGNTSVIDGRLVIAPGGSIDGTASVLVSGSVMEIAGGTVATPGVFRAETGATALVISSGTLAAHTLDTASGTSYLSTFNWTGGTVHLGSLTRISGSSVARDDQPFRNTLTLVAAKTLIVDSTLAVDSGGTLNIDGGLVAANAITTSSGLFGSLHGTINFNAGTMRIMGNQTLDANSGERLDVDAPIQSNRVLEVLGTASINTPITLAGGTLTVNEVVNPQNLLLDSGTFNVAVGALAVPAGNSVDASSGMTINAAGGLAVAATAQFNLIGADFNAAAPSTNDGQINAINSAITFSGGVTNNGVINLIGSTVSGTVNAAPGTAIETSGAVTFHGSVTGGGTLEVGAGAVTTIAAGASNVVVVTDLQVDGTLDLGDNKLIVDGGDIGTFTGGSYSGLTGLIAAAYDFGAWDLPGIMTSMPDAGPTVARTTLGIGNAEDTFYAGGTFGGVPVDSDDALIMYTWAGDVDLNGFVDAVDYGTIDNWIQFPGTTGYGNGDLNYDGVIDAVDYGIIDNGIQLQGDPMPTTGAVAAAMPALAVVPEPAATTVMAVAAMAMLARRRRRHIARSETSTPRFT